ncbi:putative transcription factor C2H2 family [Helianthus anomalus]
MIVIGPGVGARNINNDRIRVGDGDADADGGNERGRNSKRDVSQLAKALEMDLDSKKSDNEQGGGDEDDEGSGGFFNCNICLEMATGPVLTCCGHLFCWCCFYQLSYVDSSAKECPVYALRRIRIGIRSIGENNLQGVNSVLPGSETNPSLLHVGVCMGRFGSVFTIIHNHNR